MEAEESKSRFLEDLEELKAKHGQEAASLRIVRFRDHDGVAAEDIPADTYTCEVEPDGNMICWHSGREE